MSKSDYIWGNKSCETHSDRCPPTPKPIKPTLCREIAIQLLPSFIHLPPDEAAKAAINYAKALIKELER